MINTELSKLTRPRKDLFIILILSALVIVLTFVFHPFERVLRELLNKEGACGFVCLVVFWLFALGIFYLRRYREFRSGKEEKTIAESMVKKGLDFIANMGHELRTPLNSILGFSEVLLDEYHGKINEKQKEYLTNIYTSGKHLLRIVNSILDLAKIDSGNMELEFEKFALKDALSDCLTLLKERAFKHNIKLSLEFFSEADIEIEADKQKFKRIILDLLANAIKFTPAGGSVRITAKINKEQTETEVNVEDTGIGIKPADMSRLFKEITQVEDVYTKKYEGIGMGLAIVKKLVELQGGRIWVESEFGKGTKVTFTIPLKPAKIVKEEK